MTDIHQENLSAGVDGELSEDAVRFLWRWIGHKKQMLYKWQRYHLLRDILRRECAMLAAEDFSACVMQAIAAEESVALRGGRIRGSRSRYPRWLHWSAGGVIAAGVAGVAIMVTQPAGDYTNLVGAPHGQMLSHEFPVQKLTSASQSVNIVPRRLSRAPATVPHWLSSNDALQLSEPVSMTVGGSPRQDYLVPTYRMDDYRRFDKRHDGYLLLLYPVQPWQPATSR